MSSNFLCGGSSDYYELPTYYLKPSADSIGTNSNLELLPDLNAECGVSARAVVVVAANKVIMVAVLEGTTTIYYNTYFTCTNNEIITLLTLLLYYISHLQVRNKKIH